MWPLLPLVIIAEETWVNTVDCFFIYNLRVIFILLCSCGEFTFSWNFWIYSLHTALILTAFHRETKYAIIHPQPCHWKDTFLCHLVTLHPIRKASKMLMGICYQIKCLLHSTFHMYQLKNGINVLWILSADKFYGGKTAYIKENLIKNFNLSSCKHSQRNQHLGLS